MTATVARAEPTPPRALIQVSHNLNDLGGECLLYSRIPLQDDWTAPAPRRRDVDREAVRRRIDDLRKGVDALTQLALRGHPIGGEGVDAFAEHLARAVLPQDGFQPIVGDGLAQLDTIDGIASEIPWEVLEEKSLSCPRGHPVALSDAAFCPAHGELLVHTVRRLAIDRQLTHLVRGDEAIPLGRGREFLIIQDPREDLFRKEVDVDGVLRSHVGQIAALLRQLGFEVRYATGRIATVGRVRHFLQKTDLGGIYYFGHGSYPPGAQEGHLLLSDGVLGAAEIATTRPSAGFVFLNACSGAAGAVDWAIENRERSVARAFARGNLRKVVVAPLWPIAALHAAESAVAFFEHAVRECLGDAMQQVRRESLEQYQAGVPHMSWMAYRFFGDPARRLVPGESRSEHIARSSARPRVFDASDELDVDIFAFAIGDVMLRAAKRRNGQARQHIACSDFLAGLVRKGDLTRHVLRSLGIDPDDLYELMGVVVDVTSDPVDSSVAVDGDADSVDRWLVREGAQLNGALRAVLVEADRTSQLAGGPQARISEHDVLSSILARGPWASPLEALLPREPDMRRCLEEARADTRIDENGRMVVDDLEPSTEQVIEHAHVLAQQAGRCPIPSRLVLAAFLLDPESHASNVCATLGLDREILGAMLVASSKKGIEKHGERVVATSFGLSLEACERAISPSLDEARRRAEGGRIGEDDFFEAFCATTRADFKFWLLGHGVDLDALGAVELATGLERSAGTPRPETSGRVYSAGRFEPEAWHIVKEASEIARVQHSQAVRTPHVFVALINDPDGPAAARFAHAGPSLDELRARALALVPRGSPGSAQLGVSPRVAGVLSRAIGIAEGEGQARANPDHLFRAFFEARGVITDLLTELGIEEAVLTH